MPGLAARIARRIARGGAITVAEYMAQVLTDPQDGYYMTGDRFGRRGDFITAPEISQMFGELIGLWCVDSWQRLGAPENLLLVELGPGRGTLMADALRAAKLMPDFLAAIRLHLVEVSPALRDRQAETLKDWAVEWHAELAALPAGPMLLIANEFFDALPIRQIERTADGWCERLVGLNAAGRLEFALSAPSPACALLVPEALRDTPPGGVVEISPAALNIASEIARRIAAHAGAALIIDYGRCESAAGPSLQAVRQHQSYAVLEDPGSADLTAHVDFAALAAAATIAGAEVRGPVAQGGFLKALGIDARTEALLGSATPNQARDINAARDRLVNPNQMGALFKVLALTRPGLVTLAGFG